MGKILEKPKSLSLIDFFIKKTAIKTLVPENIADSIIKDQWKSLHQMMKKEIDLDVCDIGCFKMSRNMTLSSIKRLENSIIIWEKKILSMKSEEKKIHTQKMIDSMKRERDNYKRKILEYEDRFPRTSSGNVQQTSGKEVEEENSKQEIFRSL